MPNRRINPCVIATLLAMFSAIAASAQSCCDSACDAMSGDSCFLDSACGDLWQLQSNTLYIHRSRPDFAVLGFNTADPSESFNANRLDYDFENGTDITLSRQLEDGFALEIRYLGVESWDTFFSAATTPNDSLQFNAAVPVFADAGDSISAYYESDLHNGEINLRHQCYDSVDFLIGFRALELDEKGAAVLENASVPFTYHATTKNRLYGAQLGAQAWLWCADTFSVDGVIKAGIFGNNATHNASATTGTATVFANGADSPTSFVGELGLNGLARLNDQVAVRLGYRVILVDEVALAAEQLAASDFFAGTGIDRTGDVLYHGMHIGLELKR